MLVLHSFVERRGAVVLAGNLGQATVSTAAFLKLACHQLGLLCAQVWPASTANAASEAADRVVG